MLRLFVIVLASFVAVVAASAAPVKWNVDQAKSSLEFAVVVEGLAVKGKFKAFGSQIAFCTDDLAHSAVRITIPMDEAKTGLTVRDAMLLKPAWFNILDFPQAVFQTTSFTHKGGNRYEAAAKLTLKGVSKDITLPFTLDIAGDTAVMKGETVLKRLAFGVGQGPDFATGTPVALDVKVMVNVTARRAK
jgi:polyisoprenoid-binding protein YceI